MTSVSMNCSISLNATMSSYFSSTSSLDIPRIAAFRYTFSRPLRSGWNPAPTSIRPAMRPRVSTCPSSGRRTPEMSFNIVDLPEPLKPRSATDSPWLIEKSIPLSASNVLVTFLRPIREMKVSLREGV